jgi:hypothetical protein
VQSILRWTRSALKKRNRTGESGDPCGRPACGSGCCSEVWPDRARTCNDGPQKSASRVGRARQAELAGSGQTGLTGSGQAGLTGLGPGILGPRCGTLDVD